MTGYFSRLVGQSDTNTKSKYESSNQRDNSSPEISFISEVSDSLISANEQRIINEDPSAQNIAKGADSPLAPNKEVIKVVDDKAQAVKHTPEGFDSGALPSKPDSPLAPNKEVIKVVDDKALPSKPDSSI